MKVFGEQQIIAPVGIMLKLIRTSEDRPVALIVPQENPSQAALQFQTDLPQIQPLPRPGRTFDGEIIAEKVMKLLKRLNDQEVDRKPDWPPPIGIASKQTGPGLCGS